MMDNFWGTVGAVGAICLAAMMAPLYVEQEEPDDMGRRRNKRKRERKRREQEAAQARSAGGIRWSKKWRKKMRERKKKRYPKALYPVMFYTAGVKNELGSSRE